MLIKTIIFLVLDLQKLLITSIRDRWTKDELAIVKRDSTLRLHFVLLHVSTFITSADHK